jgi:hypothetical protein
MMNWRHLHSPRWWVLGNASSFSVTERKYSAPIAARHSVLIKRSLLRSLMSIRRADNTDGADANAAGFHFGNSVIAKPGDLCSQLGNHRPTAFARSHDIPIQWAEKGVRKEDFVQPWLRRMVKKDAYGVYFIFKSMEQGPSFRVTVPKFPTKDPNHRILAQQKSRFTHNYFYIRDEVLGPMIMRVATFFPFRTTYYLNGHSYLEQELNRAQIGFRKNDNAFLAVDDVAALQAVADKLSPAIILSGSTIGSSSWGRCSPPRSASASISRASIRSRRSNTAADLRKLKGHALLERDGSRYAYRSSPTKGLEVALLFLFFHKRLCGPLARHRPDSRLEAAYYRADAAIRKVVDLLAACRGLLTVALVLSNILQPRI